MKFLLLFLFLVPNAVSAKRKNPELLDAVLADNLDLAQKILDEGGNPNQPLKKGRTILICAAERGHVDIIDLLLERGANPDHVSKNNETAILMAAANGRIGAFKTLLAKGVDLNVADRNGRTPLMLAVKNYEIEMVDLLLAKGVDLNVRDRQGHTALMHAVKNTKPSLVKRLLGHGADYNIKDKTGNHSFQYAHFLRHYELAEIFKRFVEDGCIVDAAKREPDLFAAAQAGDIALIDGFLGQGVDVNSVNERGETALMHAVQTGKVETMKRLLSVGANPNLYAKLGHTALSLAVQREDEAARALLIQNGAEALCFQDETLVKAKAKRTDMHRLKKALIDCRSPVILPTGSTLTKIAKRGTEGVTPPVFTKRYRPEYPKDALAARIQGSVTLACTLGPDGTIYDFEIIESLGDWAYGFEYSAIASLKRWKYEPSTENGTPIPFRMVLKISFLVNP